MKNIYLIILTVFCIPNVGRTQDFSAYERRTFKIKPDSINYRILFPKNYNAKNKYPLIIFLHGSGGRGSDNEKQLTNAGPFFLRDSIRKKNKAIVIVPQCPVNDVWAFFSFHYDSVLHKPDLIFTMQDRPTKTSRLVKILTDSLINAGIVDSSRIFIGGLSLGGFGTFDFIERYPGYFSRAFPICGGGDTSYASSIAGKTSLWIFHGSSDPVVSVRYSRQYFSALKRNGAIVYYTEYKGVRHNSWINAFSEPGLMEWIQTGEKKGKD